MGSQNRFSGYNSRLSSFLGPGREFWDLCPERGLFSKTMGLKSRSEHRSPHYYYERVYIEALINILHPIKIIFWRENEASAVKADSHNFPILEDCELVFITFGLRFSLISGLLPVQAQANSPLQRKQKSSKQCDCTKRKKISFISRDLRASQIACYGCSKSILNIGFMRLILECFDLFRC